MLTRHRSCYRYGFPASPAEVDTTTGYLHRDYAHSLAEFGVPRELPRSRGWLLKRTIPGFQCHDAMGCYPLFSCQNWSQLTDDLGDLGDELVALSLVTDPFGAFSPADLRHCFPDVLIRYKEHFVVDLARPLSTFVSDHHRRYMQKAFQQLRVETCQDASPYLDEWLELYAILIQRHTITGMRAFSPRSMARQLRVPGMVAFRAVYEETTVGMLLWYVQDEVGYYHLGAYSHQGYALRASFALFASAIGYFAAQGLRWLNLGAGAGVRNDGRDGLSRFKRGWSTGTRPTYFCGRIFDPGTYTDLVRAKGIGEVDYFPAYRWEL